MLSNHFPYPSAALPEAIRWPTRIFFWGLVLLTFGIMLHPLVDPDVYIHLRDGRHWVESGFQVDKDPFAYTAADQPFEKVEWLFRILLYLTWTLGGYSLLIVFKALVMTLAIIYFSGLLYRRWPNLGLTGVMIGISILAVWTRIAPERPQMFTYLLLPLVLHLLEDYRLNGNAWKGLAPQKLWLIPVMVIPWANLHPGFVILFVFLGAQIVGYIWEAIHLHQRMPLERAAWLSAIAITSFLAGAVGLSGFDIYHFIFQMLGNATFLQNIVEWMPPELGYKPVFFLLLGFIWLVQLFSLRHTRFSDMLLLIIFSYLALKSRRNIPLFLVAAMPALISNLRYLKEEWFPLAALTYSQQRLWLWIGSGILGAILLITLATGYSFRTGQFPDYHPVQGLQWVQDQKLTGRLFSPLHWGGYIGWETHGRIKVFMDGRLPTFAGKVFDDYSSIIYGNPEHCLQTLDEYNIQIILVSPKNFYSLFQQLAASKNWVLVYWDHVSQVFIRKSGPNQSAAEQFEYKYIDPNATPFSNPAYPEQALQEIDRAIQVAPFSYLPLFFKGDLLLQQNQAEAAQLILDKVFALEPKHAHTLVDLGILAMQREDNAMAENKFLAALRQNQEKAFQAKVFYYLATVVKKDPLRRNTALAYAEKALRLIPGWPAAMQLIQDLD